MSNQTGPVPRTWCTRVAAILREAKDGTVFVRKRARRDWASLPSSPFDYELPDAIAAALEDEGLVGKKYEMEEAGETYGFIFHFANHPVYAKVNLTTGGEVVIVYSAHRPLKGEEL